MKITIKNKNGHFHDIEIDKIEAVSMEKSEEGVLYRVYYRGHQPGDFLYKYESIDMLPEEDESVKMEMESCWRLNYED